MKIKPKHKFIYRAISGAELEDLKEHGLRIKPGGFEFGKLFALSFKDAVEYGRIISSYDNLTTSIIKASVPQTIFKNSEFVEADGMDAVLIEKEYLNLLKIISNTI